jgi:hypothetical protein
MRIVNSSDLFAGVKVITISSFLKVNTCIKFREDIFVSDDFGF